MNYPSPALAAAFLLLGVSCINAGEATPSQVVVELPMVPLRLDAKQVISNPTPNNPTLNPKRYIIWWNDEPGIDGSFEFVVHPTQIFLRSFHNNPNPNFVYWVSPISNVQYRDLCDLLEHSKSKVFLPETELNHPGYILFRLSKPWTSPWLKHDGVITEQQWEEWYPQFDAAVNENLSRILKELNRLFPPEKEKLSASPVINRFDQRARISDS